MKLRCLLSLALVLLAGCSTPATEVVRLRDGVLRAPTHAEASTYCEGLKTSAQPIGKAPGDTGILFRCR